MYGRYKTEELKSGKIDFSKAKLNICEDYESKKCFKDNLCSTCCLEQTKRPINNVEVTNVYTSTNNQ